MFDVIKAVTLNAMIFLLPFKAMLFVSYRFTTKYVVTTPIRTNKTQNALRIPLNSDVNLLSATVSFDTKKEIWYIFFDNEVYFSGYVI